jgi:hypothetical protein
MVPLARRHVLRQAIELGQGSDEREMHEGMISVCLNASTKPGDGFCVGIELQLGEADRYHLPMGGRISWRATERLVDMRFGLGAPTENIVGETDPTVSLCQISIRRQRPFAFSAIPWAARFESCLRGASLNTILITQPFLVCHMNPARPTRYLSLSWTASLRLHRTVPAVECGAAASCYRPRMAPTVGGVMLIWFLPLRKTVP